MKPFFKAYKKQFLQSLALLLFIVLMGSLLIYSILLKQQENFQTRKIQNEALLYKSTKQGLQTLADNTFLLDINIPEIKKILQEANNPTKRDVARKKLFQLLEPKYRLMKETGTRQLHFHLPGAISFLRFHKPSRYGDSLKGIRYSVELVNKTKQIVRGFEEGRVLNGFRNVYPLFNDGKFLGTVEISYSLKAFIRNITKVQRGYYGLLLKNNIINKKVWKEEQRYYEPSIMAPGYSWDKKSLQCMFSTLQDFTDDDLKKAETQLAPLVSKKLKEKKDFLINFECRHGNCILIFKYIYNIKKEPVAIFVVAKYDNFLQIQKETLLTLSISGLILALLSSFLFFIYLKKNHDFTNYLEHQSITDPLTELFNRRGFLNIVTPYVTSSLQNRSPFSILFLDIDHFKQINDTYGHEVGDKVLKELSKILRRSLRKSDIITRWGGEEFIIFLKDTPLQTALEVAEKLRQTIQTYTNPDIPPFTVSIGVYQNMDGNLDKSIKKADEALYKAKRNGRNKVEVVY
ncbi:MAG: diguanylate cyclase [Epsilonproteobacteria bacterium]|nr:diguanylate cyclase [Campylobacterota bacterium]